jgi:hypothetical protein
MEIRSPDVQTRFVRSTGTHGLLRADLGSLVHPEPFNGDRHDARVVLKLKNR